MAYQWSRIRIQSSIRFRCSRWFVYFFIKVRFFSSLAGDMVRHAKQWKSLPTRVHCSAGNITGKQ